MYDIILIGDRDIATRQHLYITDISLRSGQKLESNRIPFRLGMF